MAHTMETEADRAERVRNGENTATDGGEIRTARETRLLFDLDGTLTDSAEGILKSVREVLVHYGIAVPDEEKLREFIGPPLRMTFAKYGVPAEEIENALKRYRSRYFSVGKFENRPYDGIAELLDRLRAAGFRIYVATSKPEDLAVEILRHFGLAERFDLICGALIGAGRDSKAKVIEHLFEEIGVDPREGKAVMIGDTAFDVLGAKAVGLEAIAVTWGYGSETEMAAAGAAHTVSTPEELYALLAERYA